MRRLLSICLVALPLLGACDDSPPPSLAPQPVPVRPPPPAPTPPPKPVAPPDPPPPASLPYDPAALEDRRDSAINHLDSEATRAVVREHPEVVPPNRRKPGETQVPFRPGMPVPVPSAPSAPPSGHSP